MKPSDDCVWLEPGRKVERAELVRMCGLSEPELDELIDYGSISVVEGSVFCAALVPPLREAVRVRAMFDLDLFTAGLLLHYLQRIDELEIQVRGLATKLPVHGPEREGPAIWREPHA